jgi:hypothetical protein
MNKLKCSLCVHYDPILGPNEKDTKRGWCAKKSFYPTYEGPGQVFPRGVARVNKGELAKPFIVKKDQVVAACTHAKDAGGVDPIALKKEMQTVRDKDGARILS